MGSADTFDLYRQEFRYSWLSSATRPLTSTEIKVKSRYRALHDRMSHKTGETKHVSTLVITENKTTLLYQ